MPHPHKARIQWHVCTSALTAWPILPLMQLSDARKFFFFSNTSKTRLTSPAPYHRDYGVRSL